MAKTVVRNAQYRRGGLGIRQRHNERQNADYMNDDIVKDRAAHNVHYKQAQGSYESTFDKMVADGVISTRGLCVSRKQIQPDLDTANHSNNRGLRRWHTFPSPLNYKE